jgi:hypothetical protein
VFRTKFWLGAAVITGAQVIGYGLAELLIEKRINRSFCALQSE